MSSSNYGYTNNSNSDSQFDPEHVSSKKEEKRQKVTKEDDAQRVKENSQEVAAAKQQVMKCYDENEENQEMSI